MKIKELREKRATAIQSAKDLKVAAESESRDLTAEDLSSIDAFLDEADGFKAQIEDAEKAASTAARLDANFADLSKPSAPKASPVTPVIENVRDRSEDDPTHGYANIGEFATSVYGANPNVNKGGNIDQRLEIGAAVSGMQQAVGAEGGFLVPPEFSKTIWDGLNEMPDNLLGMTDTMVLTGTESITIPANAETSRATGSRFGGVQGFWIAEADQITSSTPKLRNIKLEPQQLAVLVFVTDKLLKNASALSQYVNRAATDEINFLVGDAIIDGTGSGQPLGVLQSGALVSVAKESGQSAKTVVTDNIHKMWARLHPRARLSAVWFINIDVEPQLQTMGFDVGNGGVPLFLPAGSLVGNQLSMLKGAPIMPIEYCKTIGTKGDIILASLKEGYTTATRGGIDSAMSIHLRFDFAETAFRFMFEVDGKPWLASPLTPFNGTDTLTHFVSLDTRA